MAGSAVPEPSPSGVTPRALLLGLALIPLNAYWVVWAELRWYMILTLNPLFVTPVFFLVVLAAVNAALGSVRPRWRFSTGELLTVYVMLAISCTVATLDYIVNWVRMVGWGAWFATPENRWAESVFPHVPRWALMWDEHVLRGFFEGGSTLYRTDVLRAWTPPLAAWIAFMLLSFGVMFCLTAMVRKAWIEETKLSFPIVRLPLGLAGLEAPGFLRSPVMWAGAGLAMASGALNGLAGLFPGLPHFSTSARFPQFATPPWNALGWMPCSLYPFAIGLAYFVPLDVLFSCWLFYLLGKAQSVVGYQVGLTKLPGFPFPAEQAIGAWAIYGLLLLRTMRGHWQRLFRGLRQGADLADRDELLPYRRAAAAGAIVLLLLLGFWRGVGMRLLPAAVAVGAYFLLSLSISRVRAEAGAPHDVVSLEPMNLFRLVDRRLVGAGDVVGAGLSHWFWRFNRSHAMPTQLEALKLWHAAGLKAGDLLRPMAVATVVSCLAAPWAALHVAYRDGASAKCMGFLPLTGQEMWGYMARALTERPAVEWPRLAAVGSGGALVLALWGLQARYTWVWLHPLGYCAGPSLNWVWLPFAIAWLAKALIVRYGGQTAYRRWSPFFLGLVLGDYLTGAAWALVSPALGFQGYHIFH